MVEAVSIVYTVVIAVVCVFVKTEERNATLRRSGITTMQMKVDNLNANDKIAMEETNRRWKKRKERLHSICVP